MRFLFGKPYICGEVSSREPVCRHLAFQNLRAETQEDAQKHHRACVYWLSQDWARERLVHMRRASSHDYPEGGDFLIFTCIQPHVQGCPKSFCSVYVLMTLTSRILYSNGSDKCRNINYKKGVLKVGSGYSISEHLQNGEVDNQVPSPMSLLPR